MPEAQLFYAFAVPAVLVAGVSKGGFGAGAAFAATPLLALAIPPSEAIGVMLPLLMLMDLVGLWSYRGRWDRRNARALMIGAAPGVALGAAFYSVAPIDAVRLLIGAIALGFVAFQLARARGWAPARAGGFDAQIAAFWGATAGFTSFVSHAGGPPAAVQLLGQRLEKTAYQATTVLVFWWINLLKLGPFWALGLFGGDIPERALWLSPVAVTGMLIGVWAHRVAPEKWFYRLVYALLVATGLKLAWEGAAGLIG